MTYNDRNLRDSLRNWIDLSDWSNPFAVTLTLKQRFVEFGDSGRLGIPITKELAQQNYRHFMNLLNKEMFGHAASRYGKKVRAFSVLEGGGSKRLHYHSIIDCPRDELFQLFPAIVASTWSSTQWGYHQIQVDPGADEGWLSYITKLRDKADYSLDIDWTNCHNPN